MSSALRRVARLENTLSRAVTANAGLRRRLFTLRIMESPESLEAWLELHRWFSAKAAAAGADPYITVDPRGVAQRQAWLEEDDGQELLARIGPHLIKANLP